MSKEDALFYVGQEVEGLIYRAIRAGASLEEVIAEIRHQLEAAEEDPDSFNA